jgi:LuxR family maltose regulon positive regulatory protein
MATPIISTKLHIPSLPRFHVPRQRLTTRLDAGVSGKLILVAAPAGFGKTSLIAEWAHQHLGRYLISWVHLDEGDNELVRFLNYIIAALQNHHLSIGEAALSGLGSVPPAPIEVVLTSLVNDIDSMQQELILILDDYHRIDSASIHEAMDFLIEHLPEHMCLVIATRIDPPLPLHRFRGRGQMTEIRVDDLRFNSEETRNLLEGTLATSFSTADITNLENRVEGWVAGLQMLALSLQGRQDVHVFIDRFSGSHRYIMDYLTEEIYNQQLSQVQEFLLITSVLERLSGALCDFVLGADFPMQDESGDFASSQRMLEYLERANLFLLPMDDDRHWYRYHHLFASLLRQRLRQTRPDDLPRLHKRASTWYADNGYIDEAFKHALSASDLQSASHLVEVHGLEYLKRGAVSNLSGWLSKLPEEVIEKRPWLSLLFSWVSLLTGERDRIEDYLASAEQGAAYLDDADVLCGNVAAIRAYAAAREGNVDVAIEQAHNSLELLPQTDFSTRSVVAFTLGGVYTMLQDIPRALAAFNEASRTGIQGGNIHVAVSAMNAAGGILRSRGKNSEAERTYHRALKLGTGRSGRPLPLTAGIHAGLAEIYLARRDLPKASKFARIGVELGERWTNVDSQIGSYVTLAQVAYLEGNSAIAYTALENAKSLASTHTLTPGTQERITHIEELIHGLPASGAGRGTLPEPLTERELEVLRLVAEGRSNPEIADELIVAVGTVKAHTSSIYRKLDVRSRTEAVIRAQELGLL